MSNGSVVAFRTPVAWVAMIGRGEVLQNLAFGPTEVGALGQLNRTLLETAEHRPWNRGLVERVRAHLAGDCDDFLDVEIDPGPQTSFARTVIRLCRQIRPGHTLTYSQVAAQAGSPGGARAVGNVMAHNRIPLVVPCHRVVGMRGSLCGFSASGGVRLKRRLLDLEAASASSLRD